ncbi:MAG: excalibur calcium-binding domain-containing protein [Candidatus Nanopelagicales bacterium]|jgi:hypothetical protein
MSKLLAAAATSVVLGSVLVAPSVAAAPSPGTAAVGRAVAGSVALPTAKIYKNCTALNKKYPHGVGKSRSVRDRNSKGKPVADPVTNFYVSRALYNANKGKDRDKDGIACEKL